MNIKARMVVRRILPVIIASSSGSPSDNVLMVRHARRRAEDVYNARMTVRIKICGITTPADALASADFGADAIGLNFYPRSPRYVTEAQAAEILRVLPPFV